MKLTFQLPHPSKSLRPNVRVAPYIFRDARRIAKAAASAEAKRVLSEKEMSAPGWAKVNYRVVWFHIAAQRPDPDNAIASLKAYIDGIADVGVMLNDRDAYPSGVEFRKTQSMPRVEITIENIQ